MCVVLTLVLLIGYIPSLHEVCNQLGNCFFFFANNHVTLTLQEVLPVLTLVLHVVLSVMYRLYTKPEECNQLGSCFSCFQANNHVILTLLEVLQ